MFSFSNLHICFANVADVNAIKNLVNAAYRGEASKQGWTTEAALISGDTRANAEMVLNATEQTGSVILIYKKDDVIAGCVNLQQHGNKVYLGMFSVMPQLQGCGIGKNYYRLQMSLQSVLTAVQFICRLFRYVQN